MCWSSPLYKQRSFTFYWAAERAVGSCVFYDVLCWNGERLTTWWWKKVHSMYNLSAVCMYLYVVSSDQIYLASSCNLGSRKRQNQQRSLTSLCYRSCHWDARNPFLLWFSTILGFQPQNNKSSYLDHHQCLLSSSQRDVVPPHPFIRWPKDLPVQIENVYQGKRLF